MREKSTAPSGTDARWPKANLDSVERLVRLIALWGGGLMLLGLTGLTVVDVCLRYFFSSPIFGARDVAKLMLLTCVALSTAYSARTGGQVAIELFTGLMGPRITRWTEVCVRALATAMLLILTWRLAVSGVSAGRFGEASWALQIPYTPFYFILSFGMLLYALVLIVEIPLFICGRPADAAPPDL
jgi:TRAP-type C4-dicarboxylate transport system permease small subunit